MPAQRILRAALMALALSAAARGCTCYLSHPATAAAATDAVFLAVALPGGRTATVLRSWKGNPAGVVALTRESCDGETKPLQEGMHYLIYARRSRQSTYVMSSCAARPLSFAQADVAYLDHVRDGAVPGNSLIFEPFPIQPAGDAELRRGSGLTVPVRQLPGGQFYVENVPPGTWTLVSRDPQFRLSVLKELVIRGNTTKRRTVLVAVAPSTEAPRR